MFYFQLHEMLNRLINISYIQFFSHLSPQKTRSQSAEEDKSPVKPDAVEVPEDEIPRVCVEEIF